MAAPFSTVRAVIDAYPKGLLDIFNGFLPLHLAVRCPCKEGFLAVLHEKPEAAEILVYSRDIPLYLAINFDQEHDVLCCWELIRVYIVGASLRSEHETMAWI